MMINLDQNNFRLMNFRRSLTGFYLNSGIREIIPIYPLYAIMFSEHGVGPLELSILFSVWALIGIVTEIPSGALADTYSRKWLIVTSGIIKSLAFCCWYLWQDFYGYALGFIIWGLGSSIRSGAWEALLHDILKEQNKENLFTRHYGKIRSIGTMGVVMGELLGGYLIIHGYDIVLLISASIPVLASLVFFIMVTEPPAEEEVYERDYLTHLRSGIHEAFTNRSILYIFLVFTFLIIAAGILDEYVNPIIFEHGFSLSTVAYLSAGIVLAEAFGQAIAGRFNFLTLEQLLGCMAISATILFLVQPFGGLWVPMCMALFFSVFGMASTQFAGQLQHRIEGSSRATVTSVVSLGDGVGAIIWFMAFGGMAEMSSMTIATTGFACMTLFFCGIFFLLGRRWGITHIDHKSH
jgi:MFS family permease